MTGKLFVSLLFLGTLISCAKDGSDDKSSEPIAKPDTEMEEAFAEFTYPSFQNAEWQDKCDAIESFVVAFATTYLDSVYPNCIYKVGNSAESKINDSQQNRLQL